MTIDYDVLRGWKFEERRTPYAKHDNILYALSLGYGGDPMNLAELPFVYENDLKAVPSVLTVLGAPIAWAADPLTGIAWQRILHGEHRMTLHGLVKPEGVLRSTTRVSRVVDKGVGKGALVVTQRRITDDTDGTSLATIEHTSFCLDDGGFGRSDEAPEPLPQVPLTPPELVVTHTTSPGAALLYRLNGDRNPIHADPSAARAVGFDKPILHGLCTYGMATKAVLQNFCDNQPERLKSLSVRFSAPFFPGETLLVKLWRQAERVQFAAFSAQRGIAVLTHGLARVER